MKKFEDFNLQPETMSFLQQNGFTVPTPIQEQVIPPALRGKDIIGISRTGTGKTHAYLVPVMERLKPSEDRVQAVITAPTRELAAQIYDRAQVMQKVNPEIRIRLCGRPEPQPGYRTAGEQPAAHRNRYAGPDPRPVPQGRGTASGYG